MTIRCGGQRAPAKIEAVGIALMDTKQPGTGTPPLVHHHQFFYAVPEGQSMLQLQVSVKSAVKFQAMTLPPFSLR